MNELTVVFEQEVLGKEFKVYGSKEEPLFLAKDIAEWIDYSKVGGKYKVSQMLNTVDDDEKTVSTLYASGQRRQMWFLTEDGLYEVLMQSRKPVAKSFKKEVKQILKSIRKDGGYIAIREEDDDEAIMARAFIIAQKTIERQKQKIADQQNKIVEEAPKVEYHDEEKLVSTLFTLRSKKMKR
ncbi:hypothetical protein CN275_00525 [Bacillus anthracis]|nr:hypothetical protein CN275_00525 [Bacillus anthracis]PFR03840.1 hypothetical protein COK10_25125 [Bacillus anthracis]